MPQIITTNLTSGGATLITTVDSDSVFIAEGVLVSTTSPSSPAYPAIYVLHNDVAIGIAGTALGTATMAMYSYGTNTTFTVTATGSAVSLGSGWDTIVFATTGGRIFNHGVISGLAGAVGALTSDITVYNSGLISGVTYGINGAVLVENYGTIRGATAVIMSGGSDTVINRGTLIGTVYLGGSDDLFDTIGGQVAGNVSGGSGDDVFRTDTAALTILEVAGEGVADRVEATVDFDLATAAEVENLTLIGTATRGAGNGSANQVVGNFANNVLSGGAGNDGLYGGAGQDSLRGDADVDSLVGGDGDDNLRGGSGTDSLYGGEDNDTIWGGAWVDRIFGDNGEDVLIGGAGRDTLTGGSDADLFVFRVIGDSGAGVALRDVILGFETGLDLIDLTQIDANAVLTGNQAFSFIGTGAFTNVAGQVRAVHTVNSYLQADVNGDGVADFEVQLTAITSVNGNDILL